MHRRVRRTPRKKILNNLCDLRILCGEILLENRIGFHEVSYKVKQTTGSSKKGIPTHAGIPFKAREMVLDYTS